MSDIHDVDSEEAAARVCTAGSPAEALTLYELLRHKLKGWKFVLGSDRGATPGLAINRQFSNGAAICSLFVGDRVLVLDETTITDMSSGEATYLLDFSISLDTQAFSYISPYLSGRTTKLPKDFAEVFRFIARPDVNIDPIPYIFENQRNLSRDMRNADKVFQKVKGYEVLRTIDSTHLETTGEVRSMLPEAELMARSQQLISSMLYDATNNHVNAALLQRHQMMYCLLLKMVEIELTRPRLSVIEKISAFVAFQDRDLATICARECFIARKYFERGQSLTFFGKIQVKGQAIFEELDGMAWDLWHIRQCEENLTFTLTPGARYFFPAILSFDKRFIEIARLYPLKACAISPGAHTPMPFYAGNLLDEIARDMEDGEKFKRQYFSNPAQKSRASRRSKDMRFLGGLVIQLEKKVAALAGCQVPIH